MLAIHIVDEEPYQMVLDNLPPDVTIEDCDLYKQVREKALQVCYICVTFVHTLCIHRL